MRLIDANRLEEAFAKECTAECPICSYYISDAEVDVECHCGLIDRAPTIAKCGRTSDGFPFMDLRPKPTGEWNKWEDERWGGVWHYCSNCHNDALYKQVDGIFKQILSDFCPNCGAKMKGEEE